MPWTDLLAANRIVSLVEPQGREQVLDAAAQLLAAGSSAPALAAALRTREAMGSTGIGRGIAVPHARSPLARAARGAFLRLSHPVDFAAPDGHPVDLVFAMCVPEDQPELHLLHLADIAAHFTAPTMREALRAATDLAALRTLLLPAPATRSPAAA